ncbi:uncharacterized protein KY384_004437 [Bacidia gigantensis]|uniref:uncharacterized protein n=1 Tax=Bacidia gigantensis TaxID=2732470 RepID=UPI001D04A93B|nr:uncharacterized protein KY384_004437 [Bacidia gigantensis]KAG8531080.1 hypothetical protein KY384_004437 [Bacidia gigantensis]
MEPLNGSLPEVRDPYETLGVSEGANAAEIKTAYKKLALLHHPDKVPDANKISAHTRFQQIAFAYAVLSDERRRRRYDTTGSTAESLTIDDDDFNWLDFFRTQWHDAVNDSSITTFKDKYQGSEEEKRDVLAAFQKFEGNMNKVFRDVMLSNPLDDEDRYRKWIAEGIASGHVQSYPKYENERPAQREARRKVAEKQAREADAHYTETQKSKTGKHTGVGAEKGGRTDLAAIIQRRQKERATNFLDDLEARYGHPNGGRNGGKPMEEPPEEAFRKNAETNVKKRKSPITDLEVEDEDIDLEEKLDESEADDDAQAPSTKTGQRSKRRKENKRRLVRKSQKGRAK